MRQAFYKANSIAQEHLCASGRLPLSRSRIQCREESVFNKDPGIGKFIKECAFARVGIADDADFEQSFSPLNLAELALINLYKFAFELCDSLADQSAVDFQLLFARPSGANAADSAYCRSSTCPCYAIQMRPHPRQSRICIFQLGQFHLEPGLPGLCSCGEYI